MMPSSTANPALSRHRTNQQREALLGLAFVSPAVLGLLFFDLGPILFSFVISFTNYSIITDPSWAGLGNYAKAFGSDLVWVSLKNSFIYSAYSVPLGIVTAFLVALLLNRMKGSAIFRTAYYVPSVVPSVASAVIWLVMLNPRIGLVNRFLALIGINGPGWLIDPNWAKPGLVLMSLWGLGGGMVLYLAGLQSVPEQLYDAAKMDGANGMGRLWHVTIPMMTPTLFFATVMGLIGSFQVFNAPFIMTSGGPVKSTYFVSLLIYDNAFRYFKMGYASALAWVLFIITLVLTLFVLKSSRAWVYYEGTQGAGV